MKGRLLYYCEEILHYELLMKLNFDIYFKFPYIEKCIVSSTSPDIVLEEDSLLSVLLVEDWISCQKALSTRIRKSVSLSQVVLFKNSEVGVKITLRNNILYYFLDVLYFCILLSSRNSLKKFSLENFNNFNSLKSFSFSVLDVLIFPQFSLDLCEFFKISSKTLSGLNVTFVFTFDNCKVNKIVLKFLQFI
nr:ribosomal protein L5 [Cyanidiaceae sp.]